MWWFYLCTVREMIFKQALLTGVFLSEWKKRNIFPNQQKSDKQNIRDYSPVFYFQFAAKHLKDLFITKCLTISPLINSSLKTSPVSNPVIPVSTNY